MFKKRLNWCLDKWLDSCIVNKKGSTITYTEIVRLCAPVVTRTMAVAVACVPLTVELRQPSSRINQ